MSLKLTCDSTTVKNEKTLKRLARVLEFPRMCSRKYFGLVLGQKLILAHSRGVPLKLILVKDLGTTVSSDVKFLRLQRSASRKTYVMVGGFMGNSRKNTSCIHMWSFSSTSSIALAIQLLGWENIAPLHQIITSDEERFKFYPHGDKIKRSQQAHS